ncbi:hypothetical protein HNQ56_001201 [Anaerotaenia torta]
MISGHYAAAANSVVFPHRHEVCVVAAFNPKGDIRIDAWGIEFSGKRFRYKVETAKLIEEVHAYLKFRCAYIEFGLLKSVDLVFFPWEHRWETG